MKKERIVALLPHGKLFDRIFAEGIEPAMREAGCHWTRVYPEFSSEGELGVLCQSLEGTDLLIADVSARNPLVLFVAGYAMGIGLEVLFLTQHGEDYPFDPGKHPPIIYGSDPEFLRAEILNYLQAGETRIAEKPGDARAQFLATFGDLLEKHQHQHAGTIYLENPTTFVLVNQDMDLPLVQDLARRGRELGIRIKLM